MVLLFLSPKILSSQLSFRRNIAALFFVVDEIELLQIYVHIFTYRQIGNHFSRKFLHQKTLIRRVSRVTLLTWTGRRLTRSAGMPFYLYSRISCFILHCYITLLKMWLRFALKTHYISLKIKFWSSIFGPIATSFRMLTWSRRLNDQLHFPCRNWWRIQRMECVVIV